MLLDPLQRGSLPFKPVNHCIREGLLANGNHFFGNSYRGLAVDLGGWGHSLGERQGSWERREVYDLEIWGLELPGGKWKFESLEH